MNEAKEKLPQLLSIVDAVKYFGLSENAIRKGIRAGRIPYVRTGIKYLVVVERFQQMILDGSFQ